MDILQDTQPQPRISVQQLLSERGLQRLGEVVDYVPQRPSDDAELRCHRAGYSAKAALDATILLRQHIINRRGVQVGQHRADEGGE